MASVNFLAQNNGEDKGEDCFDSVIFLAQNVGEGTGENNLDSSLNLHLEESTDSEPCSPDYSSVHSSEDEEDVYIPQILDDDEQNNPPDPRLELVDKQFNLRMKELFTQTSSGQLVPITIETTLQQTTDGLIQYLTKSHPLTWVSQVCTALYSVQKCPEVNGIIFHDWKIITGGMNSGSFEPITGSVNFDVYS